jgi:ribosomal protein S18 acetylase RimI-like enzyme
VTDGHEAIVVRRTATSDIDAVVGLQAAYLTGSIVTDLGPRFLAAFHAAALQHGRTLAFVAVGVEQRLAGFVTASTDVQAFNAHVKPRILGPMARALTSPRGFRIGWNIVRSLFESGPQPRVPAELLLLVVAPSYRRRGIAQRLVNSLEDAFRREVIRRYRVAVRSHLAVARAFHLATGFEPEQELTVLGRPMTYLARRVTA